MPVLRQLDHDVEDLVDHLGVQRRGRLVEEHDLGLHRQRPGDRDALLLTAGELGRVLVGLVGDADALEQLHGVLAPPAALTALRTLIGPSVTFSRMVLCANRLKRLEHHADVGAQLGQLLALLGQRLAVDGDRPRLDGLQAVDGAAERRLPDPDGPRTTTTSPLPTVRSMSLSTCSSPKCLLTALIATMGSPPLGGGGVEASESCRESADASVICATYPSARFVGVTRASLAPNCEEDVSATCGLAGYRSWLSRRPTGTGRV